MLYSLVTEIITADETDAKLIEQLAEEIWRPHYATILQPEVIDYVLENFQRQDKITQQMTTGELVYFIIKHNNEVAGYSAIALQIDSVLLSKIYVKQKYRGNGIASTMVSFIQNNYPDKSEIYLYVAKANAGAVEAYKKLGFTIHDDIERDLGNGFVGYDYVMRKNTVHGITKSK